jgi:hypothetical protein
MASAYTHSKLTDVDDSAPQMGVGERQESRFATADLGSAHTGVTHHRFRAGMRQAFGRLKLDDDILELARLDAVRVSPAVTRAFEAGPDGLEVLAFGPHHEGDGELIPGWWSD